MLIAYLNKELEDWLEKESIDFDPESEPENTWIHLVTNPSIKWALSLYSVSSDHFITIEFIDFTPQEDVIVDG